MDTISVTPVRLLWPSLRSASGLHQAAQNGYFGCLLICLITLLLILLGGSAVGAFVDIFFFFLAGLGTRSFSRLAAGSAMVMLLAEKTAAMASGHLGRGALILLLLLPLLFHAAHAGFAARTMGILAEAPVNPSPANWLERIENLPGLLWPKVWIGFRFYLAGLIVMMLAGFVVRQAGLLP